MHPHFRQGAHPQNLERIALLRRVGHIGPPQAGFFAVDDQGQHVFHEYHFRMLPPLKIFDARRRFHADLRVPFGIAQEEHDPL